MITQPQAEILENLKRSVIRWIGSHGLGLPESEDIFQKAMLKAVATTTVPEESEKIIRWFYQIIRNTLIDEFRNEKTLKNTTDELSKEILPALDQESEANLCRCIDNLLDEIPIRERKIIEKHFYEGKKLKELAIEFKLSEANIRVLALRTRQKLKMALKACCNAKSFQDVQSCDC